MREQPEPIHDSDVTIKVNHCLNELRSDLYRWWNEVEQLGACQATIKAAQLFSKMDAALRRLRDENVETLFGEERREV
jgi:hypothetical protein